MSGYFLLLLLFRIKILLIIWFMKKFKKKIDPKQLTIESNL